MSPGSDGTVQIRGYHACFRFERRLHKLDRWRIPVPYGVPMRGIGYAAAGLLLVLILGALPVTGDLLDLISPWFRYAVLPVGLAWALTRWKIDGRSAISTGVAWLRWRSGPSRLSGFRSAPPAGPVSLGDVAIAPDGRSARLRTGVVEGPATLVLRYPATAAVRRRTLRVTQRSDEPMWHGKRVRLRAGQRMVVG